MTETVRRALMAWVEARSRRHEAAERLAALNVRSGYQRPDDAPEVVAWREAERAEVRAGDELYEAARREIEAGPHAM